MFLASSLPRMSVRYGVYATALLMIAYTFSFLDRQILNLMVGPIERSLHINDSKFALLTGGAFGVFYTVMGACPSAGWPTASVASGSCRSASPAGA